MKVKQDGRFYIGTSNIVVPGNKQSFPVEFRQRSRLHYYSTLFNSVELNSPFYKVPLLSTFKKWAADVNSDFVFTTKIWKEVTHLSKLQFDLNKINIFLSAANGLGSQKGCLLVQFPGKISFEYYNAVEQILKTISASTENMGWKLALEFRHPGWYVSETFELLDEFNASMVIHDIPKARNEEVNKKAKFVYLRFHGPQGDYRGSYSTDFLLEQSKKITTWLKLGRDVFVYFNNTIGEAFENTRTLQAFVEKGNLQ